MFSHVISLIVDQVTSLWVFRINKDLVETVHRKSALPMEKYTKSDFAKTEANSSIRFFKKRIDSRVDFENEFSIFICLLLHCFKTSFGKTKAIRVFLVCFWFFNESDLKNKRKKIQIRFKEKEYIKKTKFDCLTRTLHSSSFFKLDWVQSWNYFQYTVIQKSKKWYNL